jgi:hypothetical protein
MRLRTWRALLMAGVAAVAVTVGVVAAQPASAGPIESGGVAQIATPLIDEVRYCLVPTGELRPCSEPAPTGHRYTFVGRVCGGVGACYEIRTWAGECLYYDSVLGGIGHGACANTSTRYRWLLSDFNSQDFVRMRPASAPSRCVVYDPALLPESSYTVIRECSSRPPSHAWLVLLRS